MNEDTTRANKTDPELAWRSLDKRDAKDIESLASNCLADDGGYPNGVSTLEEPAGFVAEHYLNDSGVSFGGFADDRAHSKRLLNDRPGSCC